MLPAPHERGQLGDGDKGWPEGCNRPQGFKLRGTLLAPKRLWDVLVWWAFPLAVG